MEKSGLLGGSGSQERMRESHALEMQEAAEKVLGTGQLGERNPIAWDLASTSETSHSHDIPLASSNA